MLQPSIFAALGRDWQVVADAAVDAMLKAANGGAIIRAQDGRELTRITVDAAQELYTFAIEQLASNSNPGDGGIILGILNDGNDQGGRRGRGGCGW